MSRPRPRPLACVWVVGDPSEWSVAELPAEVTELVDAALRDGRRWVALTLATPPAGEGEDGHAWDGRTVYLVAASIAAVGPPPLPPA